MMPRNIVDEPTNDYRQKRSGRRRREAPTVGSIHGETTRQRASMPTLDTRRPQAMLRLPKSAVLKRARAHTAFMIWLGMYGNGWQTATTSIITSIARSTTREGQPLDRCAWFEEGHGIVPQRLSPRLIATPIYHQSAEAMSGSAVPRMRRSSRPRIASRFSATAPIEKSSP